MAIQNVAAFAQYRRIYAATVTTANGGSLSAPTNTALLAVAGPDGSLITHLSAVPRATVTATQMQYYISKDGGTTFNFLTTGLMAATTVTTSAQITPLAIAQVDGTLLSEINPISLSGVTNFGTSNPTFAGITQGSVNAQLLPFASSVTALTAGTIVDFEAGLTNTSATTLTIGTSAATSVVRDSSGAALSAGDITAGFRYRVWTDGSLWRLMVTDRLYVATGITLASGITSIVQQADF